MRHCLKIDCFKVLARGTMSFILSVFSKDPTWLKKHFLEITPFVSRC